MKQMVKQKMMQRTSQVQLGFLLALISNSALATPGQAQLSTLQMWLTIAGAIIVTISIMFAAFKMMVQRTPWADISHVFMGGVLFGIAPIVGAMLIQG